MTVEVRPAVVVRRPRRDVAAFMFDPGNDLHWTGGITSSTLSRPGPVTEGASVQRTARFLGRSFTYGYLVTKHDPGRFVEMTVQRPFPMLVRYELDDAPNGTLVAIRAQNTPGRFFGFATPVLTVPGRLPRPRRHLAVPADHPRRRATRSDHPVIPSCRCRRSSR